MNDWRWMTAARLGDGIAAGEIDPVALTETFLEAIDGHPRSRQIYARVTPERARQEAAAAAGRARAGQRRSRLDGVPVSWKDLFDTAGTVTEAGSALLKGRVPDEDAQVLRNATEAGLVCLGKTNMSELAFSGLGLNPVMGTPVCVHDPRAVAGGSSSGAAASVAFGLAAAAIGSDTAGSVRVPAAWNDLVGLRPGHGALSLRGAVPLCPRFDTVGPLARTVEDAALVYTALGARLPQGCADLPQAASGEGALDGCRFVIPERALEALSRGAEAAFDAACARLRDAGARIEPQALPEVSEALELATTLFAPEAYGIWRETIEANPDAMFDQILLRFRGGAGIGAADYVAAWHRMDALRVMYRERTAAFDGALLPTVPILPPLIERLTEDSDYYGWANLMTLRNTRIGSLLDLAGVTVPAGHPSCGLLLQMPGGCEPALLGTAARIEAILNPARRRT
ncbi:amidase [Profundibacterium mesophilum]|uniref:Glutamyl-tRNA amidotransferase subunit A n=1 Tax=Profundibacterium mesophilum KAUST100406-0324 TaxID=1037889 RepID=A0A921NZR8_9RHOB|nr:amidase family protein [Profundibacterium mesophilum]KAF0676538.1 Glutamyl-tRNA amidotransferase subunit A [Profundibacterium mesophilum KAUST100406-0324]